MKTEATGNEKGSEVANHPTFLPNVYPGGQEVKGERFLDGEHSCVP